jgi:hypothetical protein
MVVRQTVALQSRIRIRRLPSPQLTAHLLVATADCPSVGVVATCDGTWLWVASLKSFRGENYKK